MKKNPKLAIYLAAMFFSPVYCLAANAVTCPTLGEGYYLGILGGYDVFSIKNKLDLSTLNTTFFSTDPNIDIGGVNGGPFFGYGKNFNSFYGTYLGAEFFIIGNSAEDDYEVSFNQDTLTTDIDMVVTYGLSLIPGIHFNPVSMLYLRLGYNWMKMEVNETNIYDGSTLEFHQFNTLHGFNYGIGIETLFYHDINIRLEYNYTQYNSLDTHANATVTPKDNQLRVGFVYHL